MPYKNLKGLFAQIEPLQKELELRGGNGLDAPALNETRNATWHLLCAMEATEEVERADQIHKAERHAQRAIYDCREALLLLALDEFRKFDEAYSLIPVTPVLPTYLEIRQANKNAIDIIDNARRDNGSKREAFYLAMEEPLQVVKKNNDLCANAREELNKHITNENEKRRKEIRDRKLIIITIAIAFFTLVAAILAVPQFNNAVFKSVPTGSHEEQPKQPESK